MSGKKCKHCGSSEIEVDPSRGDAVCMSCGTVLEDNIIVAEVEFQENAHGGASAIGQFVSAESKGGATGFGAGFSAGIGQESREVTLRKARQGITALCQQLHLNQQCVEIACNFFKMALCRQLTKGRPASQIHAACVYITCRTEGTDHLLIDISDALQIDCYQLGRTYMRLSRSLCINIPSMDPCLYILRFASQLQFGDKKHEVGNTALRLVQRMKRDSIHSGRRPSGLCGAALLIAARLHEFSRSPSDVVRIVKVHESTLRKRLMEFGDTPSSALTLDEFMTVDLEEEQDPPAFRAARRRDKERLQKLMEEEGGEVQLTELQREIEVQLERDKAKRRRTTITPSNILAAAEPLETECEEAREAQEFATKQTLDILGEFTKEVGLIDQDGEKGLGPDLALMGLGQGEEMKMEKPKIEVDELGYSRPLEAHELEMSVDDEAYVSTLIMTDAEVAYKTKLWHRLNAGYLKEQKVKEEIRAKEREEGKDKKKKSRGSYRKKTAGGGAATAGEAIEKMLQERKMSNKINYDILRTLDGGAGAAGAGPASSAPATPLPASAAACATPPAPLVESSPVVLSSPVPSRKRRRKPPPPPAILPASPTHKAPPTPVHEPEKIEEIAEIDDYVEEMEPEQNVSEMESLSAMLHSNQDDEYYGYEEY